MEEYFIDDLAHLKERHIFIFGMGGGGDIVGTILSSYVFKSLGARKCDVGTIVWERYVVDPVPGPISISQMRNVRLIGDYAAIVTKDSYAIRNGNKVIFQASRVASILDIPIFVLDISYGAKGIKKGIEEVCSYIGADTVIAIDVGGDVLANGDEEDLWSPLADSVSLAGLSKASVSLKLLCVLGLGADGELSLSYLLNRLAILARNRALICALGLHRSLTEILLRILKGGVVSETSKAILMALNGFYGKLPIRDGTRVVEINPILTIIWLIDPLKAFSIFRLAQAVIKSTDINEANELLHKLGVVTELDIDNILYDLIRRGRKITPDIILHMRNALMRRLRNRGGDDL